MHNMETNGFHHESPRPRACIMAIAKATPSFQIQQSTYPDFYFRVTNSSADNTNLKTKFTRICQNSGVETRYSILTEKFLKEHPELTMCGKPSLEERNDILAEEVPKLAHAAAVKAIEEWGGPVSEITHLVVATLTCATLPGADVAIAKSLGLRQDVKRVILYMVGCHAGLAALRIAKDIAESNPSSRVLVCVSEITAATFQAPNESKPYDLVGMALLGDGASAMIVGAWPQPKLEKPIYEIYWTGEILMPGTEKIIEGRLAVDGLQYYLDKAVPSLVGKNVSSFGRKVLSHAPTELQFEDVFWAVHPGGPAVLKAVEEAMALSPQKLQASRRVLAEYGNVSACTVLFVLEELTKHSEDYVDVRDCGFGVALAFGPGLTMEAALLKRIV